MSDTEIRTLERQAPAVGTVERERLERTWLRSGLGWHGEPLPEGLRATDERGVYVWRQDDLAMPFVYVPAGPFLCGPEKKSVDLPAYYIARYPTTWREFHVFTRATKRPLPLAPRWGRKSRHPVVNVSWDDSVAFARWAGLDLPTGHEWEKAARGTDGRTYPWGEAQPTPKHAVFGLDWDTGSTRAVCDPQGRPARPLGASPYGAHDMVGNVWEWCAKEREPGAGPFSTTAPSGEAVVSRTPTSPTPTTFTPPAMPGAPSASAPSSEERESSDGPFPSGEVVGPRIPTSSTPSTSTQLVVPGTPSPSVPSSSGEREPGAGPFPSGEAVGPRVPPSFLSPSTRRHKGSGTPTTAPSAPSSEEREPSVVPFDSVGSVGEQSLPTSDAASSGRLAPCRSGPRTTSPSASSSEERDAPSDDPFMPSREGDPSFGPEVRGGETSPSGSSAPGSSTRNPRSSLSTSSTASAPSSEEHEPSDGPLGPEGAPVGSLGGSSSSTSPETSIWTDPLPTSRKTPPYAPSSEERERSARPFLSGDTASLRSRDTSPSSPTGDSTPTDSATPTTTPASAPSSEEREPSADPFAASASDFRRATLPQPTTSFTRLATQPTTTKTPGSDPSFDGSDPYPSSPLIRGRCFTSVTMTLDALDQALEAWLWRNLGNPLASQRMVLRARR